MPLAFILQLPDELVPTGIRNRAGQGMVRHHAAHVQVLDDDHLVFTNEPSTELVQIVAADVRNLLMDFGHVQPGLGASDPRNRAALY
jgi:hypothetical protein